MNTLYEVRNHKLGAQKVFVFVREVVRAWDNDF